MDERSRRIAARFEVPMLVASLLVIPLLIIQESASSEPWTTIGDVLNWGTWLAFLSELVVMLIVAAGCAPTRSRSSRSCSPRRCSPPDWRRHGYCGCCEWSAWGGSLR